MKGTDIKGLPVRSENTGRAGETVNDLILDTEERRVLALQLLPTGGGTLDVLPVDAVARIDQQGVVVERGAAPLPASDCPRYESKPTLNKIIQEDVVTQTGRNLGKLADIDVDPQTWHITAYDVAGNMTEVFRHDLRRIPAEDVVTGEKMIMVADRVPIE